MLGRREPVEKLLADPALAPDLRHRLELSQQARRFAIREMRLPDNGSYTRYADLGRPYVLWNVFAAPELSLEPRTWCHLFAGCFAYRGYYDKALAQAEAERLAAEEGLDTWVGGVPAYSTLGWFADPLLNTLGTEDVHWVGTIFHELAHQKHYVADDTAYVESFASFVEEEGLRQFSRGSPALAAAAKEHAVEDARNLDLLLGARQRLEAIYASPLDEAGKRAAKAREFAALAKAFGREGIKAGTLNNARLVPVGLYRQWIPAFAALFEREGRDWGRFYAAAEALAELEPEAREARLRELAEPSPPRMPGPGS